jgi:hypothetical protein
VVAVTSARYVHMVNEFLLQGLTPSWHWSFHLLFPTRWKKST